MSPWGILWVGDSLQLQCVSIICHPKNQDQENPKKECGKACGWGEGLGKQLLWHDTKRREKIAKEKSAINRTSIS